MSDIPSQNLINYNETNITDDHGAKHLLCHCGVKLMERKMHHSKTQHSFQFDVQRRSRWYISTTHGSLHTKHSVANPNGQQEVLLELCMMPLYQVGSIPNASANGFQKSFFSTQLHFNDRRQQSLVINLAAQFNEAVVDNNIHFICLLPKQHICCNL